MQGLFLLQTHGNTRHTGAELKGECPGQGGAQQPSPGPGLCTWACGAQSNTGTVPLHKGEAYRGACYAHTHHTGDAKKKNQQKKPNGLLCRMEKPDNDKGQTGQTSAPHRRFAETFRSQPPSDKETLSLQWHKTPHRIKNKYARLPRNSAIPMVQVRGEKESLQSAAARGSIFQAAKTAGMSPPPPGSTIAR